jgi:hypothetical protein
VEEGKNNGKEEGKETDLEANDVVMKDEASLTTLAEKSAVEVVDNALEGTVPAPQPTEMMEI